MFYVKTVLGKLYHLLLRGMKVRFHFMPSSIDVNKADQYARSSDGYLRCRVNYTSYL